MPNADRVFRQKAAQLAWDEPETVELAAAVWSRLKKGASLDDLQRDMPRSSYSIYRTSHRSWTRGRPESRTDSERRFARTPAASRCAQHPLNRSPRGSLAQLLALAARLFELLSEAQSAWRLARKDQLAASSSRAAETRATPERGQRQVLAEGRS